MIDTPELNKRLAVRKESQIIGEFLEWATSNGYHFTKTVILTAESPSLFSDKVHEYDVPHERPVAIEDALADYFEIDLDKVEQEQRALLVEVRAKSACQRGATS